jgi:hypothetical protein
MQRTYYYIEAKNALGQKVILECYARGKDDVLVIEETIIQSNANQQTKEGTK